MTSLVCTSHTIDMTQRVFAGDIVPKKKPDPAIYMLAAKELGLDPARRAIYPSIAVHGISRPSSLPRPSLFIQTLPSPVPPPRPWYRCVVVEDSGIGLKAAKAAGMTCVVTKSSYTGAEDFSAADAVFDCIGDAGSERFSLEDLVRLSKQA